MSPAKASAYTVAFGIVLGIIATVLIYGHALGLGFAAFVVILLGALLLHARVHRFRPITRSLILIVPILFFAVMLVVRAEFMLSMLNLASATGLALLLVYFFNSSGLAQQNIFGYGMKALIAGTTVWFQPFHEVADARKWITSRQGNWAGLTPFVRGTIITVPVVAVFVILLSSADEVFARLVTRIVNALIPQMSGEWFVQVGFAVVFAWMATGGLAFAVAERKAKRPPDPNRTPEHPGEDAPGEPAQPPAAPPFSLGFTETTMLLVSVCAVFVAFVAIQFVYLFGGERNIANFIYAEYVHRGFLELVLVALLTLGLILTLNTVAIRRTRQHVNLFRVLSTLLILLTGVILVSAFQRLRLYEVTYGFTTLRLQIYVFIGWLGVLFAGLALSLYWTPATVNVFGVTSLIAVIGFVGTLDVLNPDALVAWQNLNRGDIDPLYLATLSEEAAPALVNLIDAPEPGVRSIVLNALRADADRLRSYGEQADWRAYNLGRSAALAVLDSNKDRIGQYDPNWVIGPYVNLADVKTFARKGQTTREITRQFGAPVGGGSYLATTDFMDGTSLSRGDSSRYFALTYWAKPQSTVEFRFDMVGLQEVCIRGSDGNCEMLPLS